MPIITPGLLFCQAIGVSPRDPIASFPCRRWLSDIASFFQGKHFGPLGAGPLIASGKLMVGLGTPVETVMPAIFGVIIVESFTEMGVSRVLPFIKQLV